MTDQKNTILAVVLSAIVLIAWEYFFALPKQRQEALQQSPNQNLPPETSPLEQRTLYVSSTYRLRF